MREELLRLLDLTNDVYTTSGGHAALDKVRDGLRALAEKCAEPVALPDGWVAVPRVIPLSEDDAQSIAIFIGNEQDGFNDATLFVGVVTDDNGGEHYGLAIRSADYPEEGAIMLHEFAAAPEVRRV